MRSKDLRALVENEFEVDLTTKSRLSKYAFPRFVYYALTADYCKESLGSISDTVGQKHSTVIHARKAFKDLYNQTVFSRYRQGYEEIRHIISKNQMDIHLEAHKERMTLMDIERKYNKRYHEILINTHQLLWEMRQKNSLLSDEVFTEASQLHPNDFKELKALVKNFIKRKNTEHYGTTSNQ